MERRQQQGYRVEFFWWASIEGGGEARGVSGVLFFGLVFVVQCDGNVKHAVSVLIKNRGGP